MNNEFKKFNGWCYNCGCQDYEIDEYEKPATYDEFGSPIEDGPKYMHLEAYCPKCDTLIYVDEIQQENNRRAWDAQREHCGIVSLDELQKLPKKYGVPRERVEEILNLQTELWRRDGVTAPSIWKGFPLSGEESERVREALENPAYFLERMDAIKDDLPQEFYERVRPRIAKMK